MPIPTIGTVCKFKPDGSIFRVQEIQECFNGAILVLGVFENLPAWLVYTILLVNVETI